VGHLQQRLATSSTIDLTERAKGMSGAIAKAKEIAESGDLSDK